MATTRFCSECGERLKVRRFSFVLFRTLCPHCSPRFNPASLTMIVVLVFSAAIGFAIGHFTAAREPFYYIGTPVESSSSSTSPSADHNAANSFTNKSEAVATREQRVISSSSPDAICGARTKSGKPCRRKVKGGGYCWQHRDKMDRKKLSSAR